MTRGNYGSTPEFDEDIIEDYRRASAKGFERPPATGLTDAPKKEPFRWPDTNQQRDTVALAPEELTEAVTRPTQPRRRPAAPDDDETVVVQRKKPKPEKKYWVLDIIGDSLFFLHGKQIIVGRNPQAVKGHEKLTIEDPGRTLSKSHARLFLDGDVWMIEDLGSTNGTALLSGDDFDGSSEQILEPGRPRELEGRFRLGTLHARIRQLLI